MKTDSELQQDVIAELAWEPSVKAELIGVEVRDGVVTLTGQVGSFVEKWEAERAAQRVTGVKGLAVEMEVTLAESSKRRDVDIARSVRNVLEWTTYWPQNEIKVVVEAGWVTLSGEVDWEYQRRAAANSIRGLIGVTGVSDQIAIKPGAAVLPIKADIEAALKRRIHSDARHISVGVKGAEVTLTGTVHSWWQRDSARNSAWSTPGVRSVADNLTVDY